MILRTMRIADSFLQIFDLTRKNISYCSPSKIWTVTENTPNAGIKNLHINMGGLDFCAFNEDLTKGMKHITTDRSSILFDKECDGIAFIENTGKKRIVFCDLKSTFDSGKVRYGFYQNLISFLKMHMLLSICNGYDLMDFDIDFIVACKCFANKNKKENFIHLLQSNQIKGADKFDRNIFYSLIEEGEKCIKIGDLPKISSIDIHPNIRNKKIKLRLLMSEKFSDDFVNYSI